MLKFLYPKVDWKQIKIVGCDLDGTLYDEMEFITQVYKPIAQLISKSCKTDFVLVYSWMLSRWIQKGSSYNRIFDEILMKYQLDKNSRDVIISECLHIFRNFSPTLYLSARVSVILDEIKKNTQCF